MLVLDEADEMLNKGFKEQIYDVYRFLPPGTQVVLLSATLPHEILEMTSKFMTDPIRILVKRYPNVDHLKPAQLPSRGLGHRSECLLNNLMFHAFYWGVELLRFLCAMMFESSGEICGPGRVNNDFQWLNLLSTIQSYFSDAVLRSLCPKW